MTENTPKKHAPKRAQGEGGLFLIELRGRPQWRAITAEHIEVSTSAGAKRIKKTITGTGSTQQEALKRHKANLARFHALSSGQQAQNRKNPETLSTYYYDTWLTSSRASKWRSHVLTGVRQRIEQHVLPALGNEALINLARDDIRGLFATLGEGGKGLQDATLVNVWRNLYTLLGDAVYDDKIDVNPMDKIRPSDRPKRKTPESFYIPPHLVSTVQLAIAGTDQEPLRMLSMMLGLRIAELLGLTWDAVHLEDRYSMLEVRQQLKPISIPHGDGCRRDPITGKFACRKTGANCPNRVVPAPATGLALYQYVKTTPRNVSLIPSLVELLRKQKARQDEWKKSPEWSPVPRLGMDKLVFTTPTGKPLRQQKVGAEWRQLLLDCGFSELNQHKSRHIAITALILNNTPLSVIGSIVGHSDSRVTEKVYAQINEQDQREHMERLALTYDADRAKLEREQAERQWKVLTSNVERALERNESAIGGDVVTNFRETCIYNASSKLESRGQNELASGLEAAWREGLDREACWEAVLAFTAANKIKLEWTAEDEAEAVALFDSVARDLAD